MSPLAARALAHLHGSAGWLAALALAHPAFMLRRPRRRTLGVAVVATVLVTSAGVLGALVYPRYRTDLKPALWAATPWVGALFERKEHLGVLAVVLAWAGLALCALAARHDPDRDDVARAARVAYAGAAAAALTSAAAGLLVGIHAPF